MRGDRILESILRPLNGALSHPEVTDVVVNRPARVAIRKAGRWEWLDVPSLDFDTMDAATILIGQRAGREFDASSPYVNATLPGGQRFQGVRPPGTKEGRILWAIRRPPTVARRIDDADFDGLFDGVNTGTPVQRRVAREVADLYRAKDWRRFFQAARMAGLSMAFVGPTGSGKTDMARRMIQTGRNVRQVSVETDDEFGDAGPENRAPLLYDELQVSSDEAVRIALRLIPVEVFLQEVRGPEAYSLLRALESGHTGCTSWHGVEHREFEALSLMVRQHPAGRDLGDDRLMEMMRAAFDVICYCHHDPVAGFRVSSVRLMAAELEAA